MTITYTQVVRDIINNYWQAVVMIKIFKACSIAQRLQFGPNDLLLIVKLWLRSRRCSRKLRLECNRSSRASLLKVEKTTFYYSAAWLCAAEDAAYCYRCSVVSLRVVLKRLNRSRCRLGWGLLGTQGTTC